MVGGVAWVWFKLIQRRAKVDPVAQAATVEAVVAEAKEQAQEQAVQEAVQARSGSKSGSSGAGRGDFWQALADNVNLFQSSAAEVEGALPLLAFKT
jgi:putative ribosome biogenesis GTPase RsgA